MIKGSDTEGLGVGLPRYVGDALVPCNASLLIIVIRGQSQPLDLTELPHILTTHPSVAPPDFRLAITPGREECAMFLHQLTNITYRHYTLTIKY
jgi:hypothetical protein